MTCELEGRTALVTGGGKGIGRAISLALGQMGARVVVNYRSDAAAAEETAHETGGQAVRCDVSDGPAVQAMIKEIGQVDLLINNAGAVRDNLLLRMKPEDWDHIIQTDLTSAYHTTRATMSGMLRRRWGRIVNMTSVVGITGNPGQANYAAAKAGLIGMTKTIAAEVARRGVTVNAVAPGFIETDMTKDVPEAVLNAVPARRPGTPDEVAAAVRFLASDAAGYVTGTTLFVDGGMSA
jgi:3-oxoacyl-[acyl-carrier protein] reductase